MLKFKLALLCWCFLCLECAPTSNKYQKQIPSDKALKFMKKFGYLVDDNGQSEAIYSEENLSNIIKTLQKYGGIEETGVIDNSTLKLMTSPRCGVPDIIQSKRKRRYSVVEGWNKRNISYFIANWSSRLGENTVAKNIQKALDIWGAYGRLKFTRSFDQNADIIVSFGRGYHGDQYPFDGPGLILAHAFFPYDYQDSPSSGGDIHFDDDEKWVDFTHDGVNSENDGTDFFAVALHELGHSLGLGHSSVTTSVMFPYYKGNDPDAQNLLDYDDILGMYNLYISRRLKHEDEIPDTPSQETTPSTTPYDPSTSIRTTRYHSTTKEYRDREETTRTTRPTPPYHWTTTHYREHEETTEFSSERHNPWFGHTHHFTTTEPTAPTRGYEETTISYEGDVESVDVHKEHDTKHKIPKNNSPSLPYICNGHFDAVATLRNELFIFKDEYLWRLKEKGYVVPGYPIPIRQMVPGLSNDIKKVDAAFERPDGHIVLFTGNKLWIHDGSRFVENSPLPLTYYHLPEYLNSIDAVQTWNKNGKTYFYKNDRFWRYNENIKAMDAGYPMHMERWRGVPHNLDAATTWKGVTYFFKGDLFWKFDNNWIITTETSPLPTAPIWLGCKEEELKMKILFGS